MKNIKITLFSLLLVLSSCNDILDIEPTSYIQYPSTGSFSLSEASALAVGCYAGMRDPITYEWALTEIISDNTFNNATNTTDLRRLAAVDFDTFDWQANDLNYLYPYWSTTYTSIRNTNVLINGVGFTYDNAAGALSFSKKELDETTAKSLAAEGCFIRAYNYFNLVRLFGQVPIITENFVNPRDAYGIGKSPVADVYKLIIADLKFTIAYGLSATYSSSSANLGKANKWAAEALLAKVYLTLGGTANKALALPLLTDVISNSGHSLVTTGSGTTFGTSSFSKVFDTANEMNSEIIFAIRYGFGSNQIVGNNWQELWSSSGAPLLRGDNGIAPSLYNIFNSSDARRNGSIKAYSTVYNPARFELYKFYNSISLTGTGLRDWPVIRYADVLLMYAEAAGRSDANTLTRMNLVRQRSWSTAITAANISTDASFESVLLNERRLEFVGENQRWFDLLRFTNNSTTGTNVKTIMKNYFTNEYAIYYQLDLGIPLSTFTTNIDNSSLLLPTPSSEGL